MSDADKLREDISRMFRNVQNGLSMPSGSGGDEDDGEDLEEAVDNAVNEISVRIKEVLENSLTVENIMLVAREKGIVDRIGQAGCREAASRIQKVMKYALENVNSIDADYL